MEEVVIRKRKSKVILDEEAYIGALESIIERDYFPKIPTSNTTNTTNTTNNKNNKNNLTTTNTIQLTDTNNNNTDNSNNNTDNDNNNNISINDFFQMYTSEDNESFEVLQEKHLLEHKQKYAWIYDDSPDKTSGMLMWYHQGGKVLTSQEREKMDQLLECPKTIGDDRPNGVKTWQFRVRNQLMFPPDLETSRNISHLPPTNPSDNTNKYLIEDSKELQQIQIENSSLDIIPTAPLSSSLSLSLLPSSSSLSSSSSELSNNNFLEISKHKYHIDPTRTLNLPSQNNNSLNEKNPSENKLMPPPTIVPKNTRFNENNDNNEYNNFKSNIRSPGSSLSSSSPFEMPHSPSVTEISTTTTATNINNHNYRAVQMTPSPMPGNSNLGQGFQSPIITWGDICGTPINLNSKLNDGFININDNSNSIVSGFQIKELSNREKIGHLLQNKNLKKQKKSLTSDVKSEQFGGKNTPSSSRDLSRMMKTPLTPAGAALAEKLLTSKSSNINWKSTNTPNSLKSTTSMSITTTPKRGSGSGSDINKFTTTTTTNTTKTKRETNSSSTSSSSSSTNHTDGLLKI